MSRRAPQSRRRWRIPTVVEGLADVAVDICALAAWLSCALGALIVLGLGVHGMSKLVGTPLPTVHDDPTRVEWGGLALDLLYGCMGAAALFGCYLLGRCLLGATARAHIARVLGTLALLGLAAVGGVVAADDHSVKAGCFALVMGGWATRVARGLSINDKGESELPASFDTPVKIVNEEATTRVKTWTQPPQRPFVFPSARDFGSRRASDAEPIEGDDDSRT